MAEQSCNGQGENTSWLGHRVTLCVSLVSLMHLEDTTGERGMAENYGLARERPDCSQRGVGDVCVTATPSFRAWQGDDAQAWLPTAAPAAREALQSPGGATNPLET